MLHRASRRELLTHAETVTLADIVSTLTSSMVTHVAWCQSVVLCYSTNRKLVHHAITLELQILLVMGQTWFSLEYLIFTILCWAEETEW